MSGMEVILPYLAAAGTVNSIYGAVTGTPGGLFGEMFGEDKPAAAAAPAPVAAPAPAPAAAPVEKVQAPVAPPAAPPPLTVEQLGQAKRAQAQGIPLPQSEIDQINAYEASRAPIAPPALTVTPAAATLVADPTPVPVVSLATPPVVTKPTVIPSVTDASVAAAKKASIAEQLRRRGRASTILTDGASFEPLG